jgi:transcriptional regulator with XRE-family HTH domain
MSGPEFRAVRLSLGLSLREMAAALGLATNGTRTIRRCEAEGPSPRIAEKVLELMRGRNRGGDHPAPACTTPSR